MNGAHARLVVDVGGEEDLHLAGDLLDRLVGGLALVAERGADPLGDVVQAVAAPLERDQQRLRARRASRRARRGPRPA